MVIGSLCLHLRLDGCFSLKDKRQVLRGALDRLRNDLHLAVAEVGDQELWNSAEVGVACVSTNHSHAESILTKAIEVLDSNPDLEVIGVEREIETR